ncbi:MAG: exodeoxyribonuclease III [Myxococcota bacterium]
MRITTWNVNGLRAALRKNPAFDSHLDVLSPDAVLLQEVRATVDQLPWASPPGWSALWHPAERAGYSGVATWTRTPSELVSTGIDGEPDPEGRVLRVRAHGVELVNVYAPSGSAGPEARARKDRWSERFLPFARTLAQAEHPVVLGGDLNVAHTERDIHDPRGNKNNSGFLPHERACFGALLEAGWVDLVRVYVGDTQGPYSWWSNRGAARALDRGWRIDYLLGNAAAAARLTHASIRREGGLDVSDHAPVTIELADPPTPAAEPAR